MKALAPRRQWRALNSRTQQGVTLIEVLITLLVLAIGLLGLAALQGFSLQAGHLSYLRTQATNIGYEVADFARANRSVQNAATLETLGDSIAAERLPQGDTDVVLDAASDEITVTVSWLDERAEGGDVVASFVLVTRV